MVLAASDKSDRAFRTISEASEIVGVPQHVLRFWETRFPQLQPLKRGGNRRYYRPADMALLETIRAMLHDRGLTIRGAKLALAAEGEIARNGVLAPAPPPATMPPAPPEAPKGAVAPVEAARTPPAGCVDLAPLRAIRDRLRFALAA